MSAVLRRLARYTTIERPSALKGIMPLRRIGANPRCHSSLSDQPDRCILMSSILTNSAALSALQSFEMTQSALAVTQGQVSTGLKVAKASDNAAEFVRIEDMRMHLSG